MAHQKSPSPGDSARVLLSDLRAIPCKAVLRKAEDSPSIYAQLGRVIRHVQDEARMNLDQFADALGKDKRQVARWMDGSERPQIEAVFAVEAFRSLLAVGFAREAQSVDVVTVISVRRLA